MKKVIIILAIAIGILGVSSCQKDACPALGKVKVESQSKKA